MSLHSPRWSCAALGLLLLAGCCYPVREQVDLVVRDLAVRPRDLGPPTPLPQAPLGESSQDAAQAGAAETNAPPGKDGDSPTPGGEGARLPERLRIPSELPGA